MYLRSFLTFYIERNAENVPIVKPNSFFPMGNGANAYQFCSCYPAVIMDKIPSLYWLERLTNTRVKLIPKISANKSPAFILMATREDPGDGINMGLSIRGEETVSENTKIVFRKYKNIYLMQQYHGCNS